MKSLACIILLLGMSQASLAIPCPTGAEVLQQTKHSGKSATIMGKHWRFYKPLHPSEVRSLEQVTQSTRLDEYKREECFYKVKDRHGSVQDWGMYTR